MWNGLIFSSNLRWKFAYESVLNEDIRRRRREWSWENMRAHRSLLRRYRNAYVSKLVTGKSPNDIQDGERKLDVLNITLARKEAELEVLFLSIPPEFFNYNGITINS